MIGALLTLGVYGLWKGRAGTHSVIEWTRRHALRDRVDALVPADGDDGFGRPWRADRESLRQDLDRDAADRRLPACHARLRGARAARADHAATVGLHRRDPGRHVLLHLLKASPRRRQRGEELGDVARNSINGSDRLQLILRMTANRKRFQVCEIPVLGRSETVARGFRVKGCFLTREADWRERQ